MSEPLVHCTQCGQAETPSKMLAHLLECNSVNEGVTPCTHCGLPISLHTGDFGAGEVTIWLHDDILDGALCYETHDAFPTTSWPGGHHHREVT